MFNQIIQVIYDGDCEFCVACKSWAENRIAGLDIGFIAFQSNEFLSLVPSIPLADAEKSLILRYPSGRLVHGAEAVFHTMVQMEGWWNLAGRILAHSTISNRFETLYQRVVRNRKWFSRIVRLYPTWNSGLYT